MATLMKVACEHHCRRLVSHYGLQPWVRFVRAMRSEGQKAEHFHQATVLHAVFVPWRKIVREREEERERRAEWLCRRHKLRQSMAAWKKV